MIQAWASYADMANPTHPLAEEMMKSASWILYKLTAEKYPGIQTTKEIYSAKDFSVKTSPVLMQGKMYNLPVNTTMGNRRELYLRHTPVRRIISISVGGQYRPFEDYEIRNHTFIIKKDRTYWNFNSAMEVEIEYEFGVEPPTLGKEAALRLANELILAIDDDPACSIPANVTSVNRQGFSFQLNDPQVFLEKGRTGIKEVDLFIATTNPTGSRKKARLYSPTRIIGETRQ